MKNIYDVFNDINAGPAEYPVTPLTDLEKARMKRDFRRSVKAGSHGAGRRWMAAAACLALVVAFSQTAFAQSAINDILQRINLGHSVVVQVDPAKETKKADLSGFYDKDGKPLTSIDPSKVTELYDTKGNVVGMVGGSNKGGSNANSVVEKDLNKATAKLAFQPLLIKDLPVGYAFDRAVFYKDDKGGVSGDYVDLYYTSGSNQIYIQERRITDDTAVEAATDGTVQKTTVNGHVAAISDGDTIDWESDGVFIHISAKALSTNQLTKLAASMK